MVLIFSLVVGVDDVCVLFSCLFSSFSVAVSNILVGRFPRLETLERAFRWLDEMVDNETSNRAPDG